MHRSSVLRMLALGAGLNLSLLMAAAPPAVGVITARGAFLLDNASVSGNATLFEGNRVETTTSSSQLQLDNGARALLGAETKGVVYRDHLVLERGTGRFENYGAEALSLRIQPEGAQTTAEVSVRKASLAGPGVVLVAAFNGPVKVTSRSGVVLANVEAGRRLDFSPESTSAAIAPTSVTGCLLAASGKFRLTDEATRASFEVSGVALRGEVGHRVKIDGTISSESTGRIQSMKVTRLAAKCVPVTAKADADVSPTGSAGASAPVAVPASIATKAVIAGVAVAGAGAGTALALTRGDDAPAISPSTR